MDRRFVTLWGVLLSHEKIRLVSSTVSTCHLALTYWSQILLGRAVLDVNMTTAPLRMGGFISTSLQISERRAAVGPKQDRDLA